MKRQMKTNELRDRDVYGREIKTLAISTSTHKDEEERWYGLYVCMCRMTCYTVTGRGAATPKSLRTKHNYCSLPCPSLYCIHTSFAHIKLFNPYTGEYRKMFDSLRPPVLPPVPLSPFLAFIRQSLYTYDPF